MYTLHVYVLVNSKFKLSVSHHNVFTTVASIFGKRPLCTHVCYHYLIYQFGTEGHTQKLGLYKVLTYSQGSLEAKGNLEEPVRDK